MARKVCAQETCPWKSINNIKYSGINGGVKSVFRGNLCIHPIVSTAIFYPAWRRDGMHKLQKAENYLSW